MQKLTTIPQALLLHQHGMPNKIGPGDYYYSSNGDLFLCTDTFSIDRKGIKAYSKQDLEEYLQDHYSGVSIKWSPCYNKVTLHEQEEIIKSCYCEAASFDCDQKDNFTGIFEAVLWTLGRGKHYTSETVKHEHVCC